MARKDFETVLSENSAYPGRREHLAALDALHDRLALACNLCGKLSQLSLRAESSHSRWVTCSRYPGVPDDRFQFLGRVLIPFNGQARSSTLLLPTGSPTCRKP